MFNEYPYTDFHEMNTDWIISKIKNVETAEANTKQYAEDADAAKVAAEDARDISVQAKDDAVGAKNDAESAAASVADTRQQIDLLQARVDNIIPDGTQTAGNTELLDIRVGANSVTYTSAGDAVRGQVTDFSSALDSTKVTSIGKNLFDKNNERNISGYFINSLGAFQANANMIISHFIRVDEGENYYIRNSDVNIYNNVYDKELTLIETYSGNSHTMPADAYYIRISVRTGNVNTEQMEKGSTFTEYEPYHNDYAGYTNTNSIMSDERDLGYISDIVYLENLADNTEIVSGKNIDWQTGSEQVAAIWNCSGYIPVRKGQLYQYRADFRHFAFYDMNKNYILNTYGNDIQNYDGGVQRGFSDNLNCYYFVSPVNGYIRISTQSNFVTFVAMQNVSDDTSNVPYMSTGYSLPLIVKGRRQIYIDAADGIDAYYAKMLSAFNMKNCDVHIGSGDYIYTNTLIEGIRAEGRRGIPVGNGCRYYFATGANIYCEYTGSNVADVASQFSPFDRAYTPGDLEVYNLNVVAKNVVYAFHDDIGNTDIFCHSYFKNCYMELDNTAIAGSGDPISKALGGGTGRRQEIRIENCVFKATNPDHTTPYQNDAAYHGANVGTNTQASFIVQGCYFENIFRTSNGNASVVAPFPRVIFTGNSCDHAPDFPANWTIYDWNNDIRS